MAIVYDQSLSRPVQPFLTPRPWLDLYGVNIRPATREVQLDEDPALLHRKLPDELLYEIFIRMSPYTMGRASCVCRKWRYTLLSPVYWRAACLKSWQKMSYEENWKIISTQQYGSWRRMYQLRPRVRFDGIYVSRNTYMRTGIAEWTVTNPVHMVCYFRYFRFFSSGKYLYHVSPATIKSVAKKLNRRSQNVYGGCYTLVNDQVTAAIVYHGLKPTVLRYRLKVRGTTPGANNRLDTLLLVTSGLNDAEASHEDEEIIKMVENWGEDETHNPDVPATIHRQRVSSFVFVPFEEVETSELNLPVDSMDYFLPG